MGGSYASIGHVVYEEDIFCRFPSSLASISACSSATRLVSKRISGDEEEPGAAASEKRSAIALSLAKPRSAPSSILRPQLLTSDNSNIINYLLVEKGGEKIMKLLDFGYF